ncbi:hypothetical protein [Streptomyces brevispora]|uniref:Uncharacterized protein n=1 Tax=Streptomyces brevispora TaxID=887462 RepID=A0ABZ1GDY7_9ACTN|nr:hypothetical protein [Streptomyces brevispora]WSC18139.1 hypothetical protein OIE64_15860 [Streptomyces brevispora]
MVARLAATSMQAPPLLQDQAMAHLEAGGHDVLTVLDPAVGLLVTFAGWRVHSSRAVRG